MHSLALSHTLSPSLATRYVIQICLLVDGRTLQVSLAAYKEEKKAHVSYVKEIGTGVTMLYLCQCVGWLISH